MDKVTNILAMLDGLSGDTKMIIGVVLFAGLLVKLSPENSK